MSYRNSEGTRRNQWGHSGTGRAERTKDGDIAIADRPSHAIATGKQITRRISQGHGPDGDTRQDDVYMPPKLANPGNCIKNIPVGGGMMGHKLSHANEAPFPEKLAAWFIKSWCPPGGIVLDPFCGSGTTIAAAKSLGRHGVGCDIRDSQIELSILRCNS